MTTVGGGYSSSQSHPVMFDPFGSMPFSAAGGLFKQFANPITQGLGYGGGGSPYAPGQGPLGTFLGQAPSVLSSLIPSMTNLASTITTGANSAYGGFQNAIDNFMKQLPGFQDTISSATSGNQDALTAAKTALSDVMSPLQSRASYAEAARRALAPAREGEAARGMVEGGQAQGGEQSLLSDLAFNTMQSDRAAQQQGIAGVTNAAGNLANTAGAGASLAALGPQMAGSLFSAYPQLASLLTSAAGLPFGATGDLLSFFQQAQNPMLSLLQLIKPQMGQQSSSTSVQASV